MTEFSNFTVRTVSSFFDHILCRFILATLCDSVSFQIWGLVVNEEMLLRANHTTSTLWEKSNDMANENPRLSK